MIDNNLFNNKRMRRTGYVVQVTAVNHHETKNNTGLTKDNVWRSTSITYGITIRGLRVDFTNNPTIVAIVPQHISGSLDYPNVGDYVFVVEDEDYLYPYVSSIVYNMSEAKSEKTPTRQNSELSTWDNAVANFIRPNPPTLEIPGNRGKQYNYNPIYMTFHQKYTDEDSTNPDFGKWYDRFVLFDSSETYKNKKPFISYNEPFITSGLETQQKDLTKPLFYMLDKVENPNFLLDYFYLRDNKFSYRTDPIFDAASSDHQGLESDPVVRNSTGGVDFSTGISSNNWDQYPMPFKNQSVNSTINTTAYDEIINETLSQIRRNAKNYSNADLPYEPIEEKQIRIGRNKFIIADMHGDGKKLFLTFKSAADQQFTMLFVNDDSGNKKSQVRIRGYHGESLLLESEGSSSNSAKSRIITKGVAGSFVELYDDAETNENYIAFATSDANELTKDYTFQKGSYFLLGNKEISTSGKKRIFNNPHAEGANQGRFLSYGIYEGSNNYVGQQTYYYQPSSSNLVSNFLMNDTASAATYQRNIVFNILAKEITETLSVAHNDSISYSSSKFINQDGIIYNALDTSSANISKTHNLVLSLSDINENISYQVEDSLRSEAYELTATKSSMVATNSVSGVNVKETFEVDGGTAKHTTSNSFGSSILMSDANITITAGSGGAVVINPPIP